MYNKFHLLSTLIFQQIKKITSIGIFFNISIGRGGRFGRKGVAVNFVTPEDQPKIREIETFYGTQVF